MENRPPQLDLLTDLENRQDDLLRRIDELDKRVQEVLASLLGTTSKQSSEAA